MVIRVSGEKGMQNPAEKHGVTGTDVHAPGDFILIVRNFGGLGHRSLSPHVFQKGFEICCGQTGCFFNGLAAEVG
jgi:hypothetical protein